VRVGPDVVWLVGVVALVAVSAALRGALLSAPPEVRATPSWPAATSPAADDIAQADALFARAPVGAAENVRRLQLYNDLRDCMDAGKLGVLELVAERLRAAPGTRVAIGYDLRTFYSAVGGDNDFRGPGQEDWERLVRFDQGWCRERGTSTSHLALAQASLGAYVAQPSHPERLGQAVVELERVATAAPHLYPADPYLYVLLNRVGPTCLRVRPQPAVPLAQACLKDLGSHADPAAWGGAQVLVRLRAQVPAGAEAAP
jgi:hypothetical protein